MPKEVFLLMNLVLAFYNVGTIWAHEVDIFRSGKLLDPKTFTAVQGVHWKKLPCWIFIPVGLALIGSIGLLLVPPLQDSWLGDRDCLWISIPFTIFNRSFLGPLAGETFKG
jgi:hypothetical protein